tara:strand:+ start:16323 stop:17648 length:1326 start_codon:yes stop_codon:yes gene_type:complete
MNFSKRTGQNLYKEGKELIPNGSNLFGKRSELYLPNNWPAYYKKAKGCTIFDLDNNKYLDFTMVGIGANILGYSDREVVRAANNAVKRGNLTTLNPPEDVELAKILIDLHPWAGMVRYARTGGEINAIAVRIARSYTKKSQVAVCGYHGWHDWYLSANLSSNSELDGHLLPGLNPLGVPKEMRGLTHTFSYGDSDELLEIINKNEIGTVILEPLRGEKISKAFLQKVRDICSENNVVLIFDEVTSGFREFIGGHHMLSGINPDIALFGKTISNGIPMAVAVGKKKIMKMAEDTFISSTYWTDRSGPAAAIATIKKMKRINSPHKLRKIGEEIRNSLKEAAEINNLQIKLYGSPCLTSFELDVKDWQKSLTLYTQEMLRLGILASDRVYSNLGHNKRSINYFKKCLVKVFKIIKDNDDNGQTLSRLEGPTRIAGFGRVGLKK